MLRAGRFGFFEPTMHLNCMSHVHAFSCICTFKFLYLLYCILFGAFLIVSLSSSLFVSYISCIMAPKRKSTLSRNPHRFEASSSSSPSEPTPSHIRFRDEKAKLDFFENFSWRGIHLERQVILSNFSNTDLPTVIHSSGWESLCGVPITCPFMIIQEFYSNIHGFYYSIPPQFVTRVRGIRMVVTLDIVSEVLHVPRVVHPNYPSYEHLRTVSKDELASLFCETPSSWGECQNTPCLAFANGPRFLNMLMTLILHPLSHYNTITKPHAHFLLSLIEDPFIDFPSYFILSLIDIYKDMVTCDKLIFPSAITRLLRHFSIFYPESPHFMYMCAIDAATIRLSVAQLMPPIIASAGGVTLEAIMA